VLINMARPDPNSAALVAILLNRSARVDERDDAAGYLGTSDDPSVIEALVRVASDASDDETVVATCGESLAEICVRSGFLDSAWLTALRPEALNELIPWVRRERPDLLSEA